jgi:molybdopterin converting factor small subunit
MRLIMAITLFIPPPLRPECGGAAELVVEADTVQAALLAIAASHPGLYRGVCHETGAVRRHINLFVNNDHIRDRQGLDTPLVAGDTLCILPAVSGG